jgi:hypothetical protein
MTYREIAETVQRNLVGGDVSQDFPIELEEIYVRINQLIPFLIRKDFYESYQFELDNGLSTNTYTTFIAKVNTDEDTKEKFILLPTSPLMIHGRGLPELYYTQDRNSIITYLDASQYRSIKNLSLTAEFKGGVAIYERTSICDKIEDRLYLFGVDSCTKEIKVRMVMNILDDINANSQVPIPEHLIEPLIQSLRAWYNPQDKEIEDNSNNGRNDNQ